MTVTLEEFLNSISKVNTFEEYLEELKKPHYVIMPNKTFVQPYEQLFPYDNMTITDIKENAKFLSIYIKEYGYSISKKIVFKKIENKYIFDALDYHIPFKIEAANYKELVENIYKFKGFLTLLFVIDFRKSKKRKEQQKVREIKIKAELLRTLKSGDLVERIGKTPNLCNYIIQVDKVSDYGVTGFYMDFYKNGDLYKTCEYTTISWKYIKGRWNK